MNRLQFGVRLLLLIVALLATCFAWIGAVRSRERFERQAEQLQCESRLLAAERQRTSLLATIKRAPSNPEDVSHSYQRTLQRRITELKDTELKIVLIRAELDDLNRPTISSVYQPCDQRPPSH